MGPTHSCGPRFPKTYAWRKKGAREKKGVFKSIHFGPVRRESLSLSLSLSLAKNRTREVFSAKARVQRQFRFASFS